MASEYLDTVDLEQQNQNTLLLLEILKSTASCMS